MRETRGGSGVPEVKLRGPIAFPPQPACLVKEMIVEPRTEQERVQPLSNAPSTGAAAGKFVWQRREHCAEIPVALDYLDHRPRPVRSNSGRPAATEHLQAPASWATQPDAAEKVKKRHKACGAGTLVLAAAAAGSKRPAAQAVPVPAHAMPLSAVLAQAAEEVERLEHERDKLKCAAPRQCAMPPCVPASLVRCFAFLGARDARLFLNPLDCDVIRPVPPLQGPGRRPGTGVQQAALGPGGCTAGCRGADLQPACRCGAPDWAAAAGAGSGQHVRAAASGCRGGSS